MNIVFWLIAIILLVAVWFGLCSLYKPIGNFLWETYDAAKENMKDENEKEY